MNDRTPVLSVPPIVAIGGSAGALEPLARIVAGLPDDLAAAVLVVIHIPPRGRTALDHILTRVGRLPAAFACDDEPLLPGEIRIAPPDRHLVVRGERLYLSDGPRVNNHRPAVDTLFRSASRWRDSSVVGVVLSGALDDGSIGLLAVAARGGTTIVQAPDDALFPDMPINALHVVRADRVLPADLIAPAIVEAVSERASGDGDHEPRSRLMPDPAERPTMPPISEAPHTPGPLDVPEGAEDNELVGPSTYSCPTCGGVLWETKGDRPSYRCRVGHAFSSGTLDASQEDVVEDALWTVLRTLEERMSLNERLARRARETGDLGAADRFDERRGDASLRAQQIREVLTRGARASA